MKQKSAKGIKLRNNIIVHTILAVLAAVCSRPFGATADFIYFQF